MSERDEEEAANKSDRQMRILENFRYTEIHCSKAKKNVLKGILQISDGFLLDTVNHPNTC